MKRVEFFATHKFETSMNDQYGIITGYIPYYAPGDKGTEYEVSSSQKIRFKAGAFTNALNSDKPIFAYYNHDDASVIASTQNNTLKFADFPNFLRYQATLNLSDPDAQRVYSKVSTGLVQGTSFGGTIEQDVWYAEDDFDVNEISDFAMFEVSPTAMPAFKGSKVVVKAGADDLKLSWLKWKTQEYEKKIQANATKYK